MEASTPLEGNAFIKAKVDAEAAGKSTFTVDGKEHPVQMHGEGKLKKAKRLSEKGGQGQGGYDYENEKVVKLVKEGKALNASHTDSKKQEDAVVQDDMDASQESSINMNAPLKKKLVKENIPSGLNMNSPLNAYVDGSENKTQDLTGVMKDYFSSVKSTTAASIKAGKNKKTKQTEADKKVYDDFISKQDNEFANQLKKNEEFRNLSSEERIKKVLEG